MGIGKKRKLNGCSVGLIAAVSTYSVPKPTLKRRLEGQSYCAAGGKEIEGSLSDLPPKVKYEIENDAFKGGEYMLQLTAADLRSVTHHATVMNNIPTTITQKHEKTFRIESQTS
jgi:hypothetical protein